MNSQTVTKQEGIDHEPSNEFRNPRQDPGDPERAERIISGGYEGNDVNRHNDCVKFEMCLEEVNEKLAVEWIRDVKVTIELDELLDFIKMVGLKSEISRSVNDPTTFYLDISGFQNARDVFVFNGTFPVE